MGTTSTPYDIKLWIYPGADPAASPALWGADTDISDKIRYPGSDGGTVISYEYGRQDEANQVDASSMSLTLDNRTGDFSTKNPQSAYYPDLTRNTPVVLGMTSGEDTFTRSASGGVGTSDGGQAYTYSGGSTANISANGTQAVVASLGVNSARQIIMDDSASADYDVVMTAIPTAVTTGTEGVVAAVSQWQDSSNYLIYKIFFNPAGEIKLGVQRVGTTMVVTAVSPGWTYSANQKVSIRARRLGQIIMARIWRPDSEAEPATWLVTGTDTVLPPADLGFMVWRLSGNTDAAYSMKIDNLTMTAIEYVGTVIQWPQRWDKRGDNSWAPIKAAGVLRRLSQGSGPLLSPLTRQLPSEGPTQYVPLEDGSDARSFGSMVSGQLPASYGSVTPAADQTLPGGGPAPTLSATNGHIYVQSTTAQSTADGFSVMFFSKLASLPGSKTTLATIHTSVGKATKWVISIGGGNTVVEAFDGTDTLLSSATNAFGVSPLGWVAWQLETLINGANTEWSFISHDVGDTTYFAQTGSHASTVVSSARSIVLGNSNLAVGTAFAHVWIGPNTLPFVTDSFSLVSSGYAGELASDRISRLCTEEGIPVQVEDGTSDALGIQPQSSVLAALRLAAETDLGILYESGAGLAYRPRTARYNQDVSLTLVRSSGQVGDPPESMDDDQRYRNKWTVTRDDGSFGVYADAAEIAREGLTEDTAAVNSELDTSLVDQASWRTHMSTYPALRWSQVSTSLARNTTLVPFWRAARYAFRMAITLGLTQTVGSEPDVIVEGASVDLWPDGWNVRMNASPAGMWDIGVYDDAGTRYDSATTTLAEALDTTETGVDITSTASLDAWATAGGYDIVINGERMTVTSVTGAAGSGPYTQTMTVVRSVNSVIRSHASGDAVHLYDPDVYGL